MRAGLLAVGEYLRRRYSFPLLNFATAAILMWLVIPLYDHESSHAWLLGRYSPRYTVLLTLWTLPSVLLLGSALVGSRKFNRTVFLIVLATFIFGETAVRVQSYPGNGGEDVLRFPKPYVTFGGKPDAAIDSGETLNALGFRRAVPSTRKGTEFRVVVLGGSTVFNGHPLSISIAGHLERLFTEEGHPNVKVYNWGVVSSVSGQELSLLLHVVADVHPDLVIVYGGGNDVFQPFVYDPRPGYPINWLLYEAGLRRVRGGDSFGHILGDLLAKSRLVKKLSQRSLAVRIGGLDEIRDATAYRSPEWEREVSNAYLRNIDKMCAIAQALDFKLAVFLQPMAFFKTPLLGNEASRLGSKGFQDHIRSQYDRIRGGMNELSQDYADTTSCNFFDISDTFLNYEREVFVNDFIHVDDAGRELVANRIYKKLETVTNPN